MAIYRYQSESLVDSVQILTNEKGGLRAYLYADNGADSEKLRLVKQALRAEGYKCVPTLQNDKPVLEVRGFNKSEQLTGYLGQLHAVKGKAEVIAEEGDKRTSKEKFSGATLKLAGFSYNVGDIAYLTYAWKTYRHEFKPKISGDHTNLFNKINILAGVGYGLGSLSLSFFGSKDQSLNTINAANQKVYAHFRNQGIDIEEGSTLKSAMHEKDRGLFGNINHTLAKYPSETLNSVYVGVGTAIMAVGAYKATRPIVNVLTAIEKEAARDAVGEVAALAKKVAEQKAEQKAEWWDVGLGAITTGSAMIGLTVKEKKPVEGEPKRKGFGRIIEFIQEKPLRATGIGYAISTMFHAKGTIDKYNMGDANVKNTIKYRGAFVAANVLSEFLLALSSKGHGVGVKPDESVDLSVIAATAELMMRQPSEKRDAMIENMAGFLSSREVLGGKSEVISEKLRNHIAALQASPWTKHYVPNPKGEMVDAAVVQSQPISENKEKPSPTVTKASYIARQQTPEHALT